MQLMDIMELSGTIVLLSGLHIGAGDSEMRIGGTDNPVIKHPHTQEPYIPGSSLKGKIRALLEMKSGLMAKTGGKPLGLKDLNGLSGEQKNICESILKLFGASGADEEGTFSPGPSRASFADSPLDVEWKEDVQRDHLPFTEVKSENSINRIQGTAINPRFTERVPAGARFSFCITIKKLDENENLEALLLEGMKLLEMDSLGGSGSRGYGHVKFEFNNIDYQKKFDDITPF